MNRRGKMRATLSKPIGPTRTACEKSQAREPDPAARPLPASRNRFPDRREKDLAPSGN
jgi:hypothetical protein